MLDRLEAYILEFAAYDTEPLHLLISALIEKKLCPNARRAISPILDLLRDHYIECYHHSCRSGDRYEKIYSLGETELMKYIDYHEKQDFKIYPSPDEDGEYFLKTTPKGLKLISADGKSLKELYRNKNTGETLERHILEKGGKPADKHPHFKEPEGW